jgi:GT2 family glycosyltransferase
VTTDPPAISVIVPTFNRRERLHMVLQSLASQDIDDRFEIIVVSDGSTDGTDEYLAGEETPLPVRAFTQPNGGPAAARNHGIAEACGDLVVFIDDDVVASPGLLRAHRHAHERLGDRAVVIGPMRNPRDHVMSPWIAWEQAMLAKQYEAMELGHWSATARQFYTGNASVRLEHLRAAGGFNETFRRAEDVELAFRLRDLELEFHYEPAAVGYHHAERSYDAWRRVAADYGRNDVVFARDLGEDWIFGFTKSRFRQHHPMVRHLVRASVRLPRFRRTAAAVLERTTHGLAGSRHRRTVRHALSGIYAIEYHCGFAEELGSPQAFMRLVGRDD